MKYIADRGYTDTVLDRHVEKGAVLEDEYKKDNIELTEERKDYLVNERKLYIAVEEISEGKVGDITPVDDIPEGATVVDRVDIVEDNNEKEEGEVVTEPSEEKVEDSQGENNGASEEEGNKEDKEEVEHVVESNKKEDEKDNPKSNSKTNTKNSKKSEEK